MARKITDDKCSPRFLNRLLLPQCPVPGDVADGFFIMMANKPTVTNNTASGARRYLLAGLGRHSAAAFPQRFILRTEPHTGSSCSSLATETRSLML